MVSCPYAKSSSNVKPVSVGAERDLEKGMLTQEHSVLEKPVARKRNFVKQITSNRNDTELHLVAQRGDLAAVKQILAGIDSQIVGMVGNEDFDTEVAKFRDAIEYAENKLGETALSIAAERGHLDVVEELLKHSNMECLTKKNRQGLDAFHVASLRGHHAIVQVLLEHEPALIMSTDFLNTTALASTAAQGHIEVVNELLAKDSNLVVIGRNDGKTALHLAARNGHVEIVKTLLKNAPQMAWRADKKGQTALHIAVKGQNCELVKLLIEVDTALLMLPDSKGNTALHTATRKKRYEIVKDLLMCPDVNINALNRDHKTALDITEELPDAEEIKDCLLRYGALHSREINKKPQGHRTNTNSANKAAILIAQIAFAAIFTVPGGNDRGGIPFFTSDMPIKILVIFNSVAFFSSLAVIVIQINTSKGEQEAEVPAAVADITAILIWSASASISVVFMTAIFVAVGRHFEEVTLLITVTGRIILIGSVCIRAYCEIKLRRIKLMRKKVK